MYRLIYSVILGSQIIITDFKKPRKQLGMTLLDLL